MRIWLPCLALTATFLGAVEDDKAGFTFESLFDYTNADNFMLRAVIAPDPAVQGKGEVRLGFQWQEDRSGYYLVVNKGGVRLFKATQGKVDPLTALRPWQKTPGKELRIYIQRRAEAIGVIVGKEVVATASDATFSLGRAAAWVSGPEIKLRDFRHQYVDPIHFSDDFMRLPAKGGPWESVAGSWTVQGTRGEPKVPSVAMTANPFTYHGSPGTDGKALCTAGHWFWDGYAVRASVKPEALGEVGLVAYYRGPKDYLLFRCTPGLATGKKQLVAIRHGTEQVLAEADGGCEAGQWHWIEFRALSGKLAAFVDGELACQAETNLFGQGACGLYVAGQGAGLFDDVRAQSVRGDEPPSAFPESNAIRAHFLKDRFLRLWAEQGASWERRPGEAFWHKALFFTEPTIQFSAGLPPPRNASLWATICATERVPDKGYALKAEHSPDGKSLQWELARAGKEVGRTETQGKVKQPANLVLEQKGKSVAVHWGGEKILDYTDPQPLRGRRVGYGVAGARVPPEKVAARCANLEDYTFSSAPVQWRTARGTWESEPHWACVGRGAHFLGMDTGTAILWSKERYRGDLILEAFVTNAEIPAHVLETPRDLNFTICGDGVNLSSGYTFILGGVDGKEVRVLKGSKELSRSAFTTHRKSSHNQDIWFHVRIQKTGQSLKFFVDDRLVADCFDAEPIEEGHLAAWTYRTGMVLGRLRIWFADKGSPYSLPKPVLRLAKTIETKGSEVATKRIPLPTPSEGDTTETEVLNDFETDFGSFSTRASPDAAVLLLDSATAAAGKRSLAVINRSCGGRFSVWALHRPVSLASRPALSFDYRLPKEVAVNLYAKLAGQWHEIGFSAPKGPGPHLGAIEGITADGKWRHANFSILEHAKKLSPAPETLEGLAFASPDDFLLRCGLSGNPYGATFHLDNVRLGPVR